MPICEICKNNVEIIEIHHIVSKACGGPEAHWNKCQLCPTCHSRVHTPSFHNSSSKWGKRIIIEGRFDSCSGNILVWHREGDIPVTGFPLPLVYLTNGTFAGDQDEYFKFYHIT